MMTTTSAICVESVLRLLRFHGIVLINSSARPIEEVRSKILAEAKADVEAVDLALSLTSDPTVDHSLSLRCRSELREYLKNSGAIK